MKIQSRMLLIPFMILITLMVVKNSFPQDSRYRDLNQNKTYHYYDNKNNYDGKAECRQYGRYRLYDKDNKYKGYIEPTPYGQMRIYDEKNKYKGKIDRR